MEFDKQFIAPTNEGREKKQFMQNEINGNVKLTLKISLDHPAKKGKEGQFLVMLVS